MQPIASTPEGTVKVKEPITLNEVVITQTSVKARSNHVPGAGSSVISQIMGSISIPVAYWLGGTRYNG